MVKRLSRVMRQHRLSEVSINSNHENDIEPNIAALRGELDSLRIYLEKHAELVNHQFPHFSKDGPLLTEEEEEDKLYQPPPQFPRAIKAALMVPLRYQMTRDQRWLVDHCFGGSTLLHYACAGDQVDVVRYLIEVKNADRTILNNMRKLPEFYTSDERIKQLLYDAAITQSASAVAAIPRKQSIIGVLGDPNIQHKQGLDREKERRAPPPPPPVQSSVPFTNNRASVSKASNSNHDADTGKRRQSGTIHASSNSPQRSSQPPLPPDSPPVSPPTNTVIKADANPTKSIYAPRSKSTIGPVDVPSSHPIVNDAAAMDSNSSVNGTNTNKTPAKRDSKRLSRRMSRVLGAMRHSFRMSNDDAASVVSITSSITTSNTDRANSIGDEEVGKLASAFNVSIPVAGRRPSSARLQKLFVRPPVPPNSDDEAEGSFVVLSVTILHFYHT
jgi:hypothetical protein